jgi:ABC-type multidrug transport system permease subunit
VTTTGRGAAIALSRPGAAALLSGQLRYAVVDLWRARVVLIFTLVLPLVWLLVVGAIAGNETVDAARGVRVMQFVTPVAISMGILYAAYPTVAISLAVAREVGVLKRLRGTPLPAWTYLAGRIGGAVVFALVSVAVSLLVGIVGFGVQIVWRTAPATIVTIVLGIACFAAIGLAVAALSPSQSVAQGASVGTAVAMTFVSDLFTFGGETPRWLQLIGDVLPLKPLNEALQDQFNPFLSGSGWYWDRLAVVAAWGVAAALVATRTFRWDAGVRGRATAGAAGAAGAGGAAAAVPAVARPVPAVQTGSPTAVSLVTGQARAANRSAWRDPGSMFFALVMPVGLYALIVATQGQAVAEVDGIPFPAFYAASMVAWGAGVAVFLNLPEAVLVARDKGVLKRLRGTPLLPWQYLAGRTVAGLFLTVVIAAVVLGVGVAFYDLAVTTGGLLLGLVVLLVGALCLTACGFALAAAVPNAKAVGAVGLVVLLPLAFFSEVFVVGGPEWMTTVGSFFPLLHFQRALRAAWDPGGPELAWASLGVLALWLVAATLVAVRFFRWEPRTGS